VEEKFPAIRVKDGVGKFVKTPSPEFRNERHYKASNPAEEFELNNGHRNNLTSCFTLHVFLLMPYDWFDTNRVSDGKVFRSTIME